MQDPKRPGWRGLPILLAIALVFMNAACARMPAENAPPMALGEAVLAPGGYLEFCQQHPDQCGIPASSGMPDHAALKQELARKEWQFVLRPHPAAVESEPSDLDADLKWTLLNRINATVNAGIIPVVDLETNDSWSLPPHKTSRPTGDCKHYVLEKRRMLAAAGIPAASLSIAIVHTLHDETHAVLLVATDQGEVVLDNLSKWISPWSKTPYRWIERQVPGEPLRWVTIKQMAAS